MAHETDDLCSTHSRSTQDNWIEVIASWFRARHENYVRNQDILQLLAHDAHVLKDIGFSRQHLVGELGYDPLRLPESFDGGTHRVPHL